VVPSDTFSLTGALGLKKVSTVTKAATSCGAAVSVKPKASLRALG